EFPARGRANQVQLPVSLAEFEIVFRNAPTVFVVGRVETLAELRGVGTIQLIGAQAEPPGSGEIPLPSRDPHPIPEMPDPGDKAEPGRVGQPLLVEFDPTESIIVVEVQSPRP